MPNIQKEGHEAPPQPLLLKNPTIFSVQLRQHWCFLAPELRCY